MLGLSRTIPDEPKAQKEWLRQLYDETERLGNNVQGQTFNQTITSVATAIPHSPNHGTAFLLIAGLDDTAPCYSCSVAKSTEGAVGSVSAGASQAGSGTWAGITLSVTVATTGFEIAHSGAATLSGDFNIMIINAR